MDENNQHLPFAQDWATAVATNVLLEVRQAVTAAIVNTLSGTTLRNQIARPLREELTARELEISAQREKFE
jgi:flagellar motor component MotA